MDLKNVYLRSTIRCTMIWSTFENLSLTYMIFHDDCNVCNYIFFTLKNHGKYCQHGKLLKIHIYQFTCYRDYQYTKIWPVGWELKRVFPVSNSRNTPCVVLGLRGCLWQVGRAAQVCPSSSGCGPRSSTNDGVLSGDFVGTWMCILVSVYNPYIYIYDIYIYTYPTTYPK